MTAPKQVASTAQDQAGAVAGTAKDQATSVAQSASSAAAEVTGTAKEQVGSVVGETVAQAKDLTGQVRDQAAQQVSSQTEKATTALRDVAKQISEGDTSGMVGTVLTEVGNRVQGFADVLEQKGPQGLLEDVRRYARRSPGSFVLSAALAGLVTGRLVKGATSKQQERERLALPAGPTGRTESAYGTSTSTGGPAYGTTTPPAYTPPPSYTPPPAYPSGSGIGAADEDSAYSSGYGKSEPYGSRGAL